MTKTQFLQSFPEFRDTDPILIDAKLAQASARMGGPDVTIWGAFSTPGAQLMLADIAQGNLAAHYLVRSPFGTQLSADKNSSGGSTSYLEVFLECEQAVAGGFAVSGWVV